MGLSVHVILMQIVLFVIGYTHSIDGSFGPYSLDLYTINTTS